MLCCCCCISKNMALFVRVKRSLHEEPLEALVLSCKRRKTDAIIDDSVTAVFKLAGTVTKEDENINENLSKLLDKQGIKKLSKTSEELLKKSRLQTKSQSKISRYKLVNYYRAIDDSALSTDNASENKGREFTVLDVEATPKAAPTQTSQSARSNKDEESKIQEDNFVYDLYHKESASNIEDVDDLLLDGLVSVNPFNVELVHETYRGHRQQDVDSDSEDNYEDEDSNDENNWRNDYPDEDDLNSDEDDLATGMEKVMIGDEELSCDDDGSEIYDEKLSTVELLYGTRYAEYKKRVCQELDEEEEEEKSGSSRSSRSSSCSELSAFDMDN